MNCKECITYTICRNKVIEYVKRCRYKKEYILVSDKTLIYTAYIDCIKSKCNYLTMNLEKANPQSILETSNLICLCLNISNGDLKI